MKPETTDDVFDLLCSYITSAAIAAALETGLFWVLEEQPLDGDGVAEALGIPAPRCAYWLQLLARAGLVEESDTGFVPSEAARRTILDAYSWSTWAYLAGESRERFPAVSDLTHHIREAASTWVTQGLEPPNYFKQIKSNPNEAKRFTRMLHEIHLPLAVALAETLDMSTVNRLMDLGGGSGVVSLALLRQHSHLKAVVVDVASVCAVGRRIAVEQGLADRITYHESDFVHDELPTGFDLVLQCDVGHYNDYMFHKIHDALIPSGRLVVVNQFAPSPGVAPEQRLDWAFLGSMIKPSFCFPTVEDIRKKLIHAEFEVLSETTLPASTVKRWSGGWNVVEARRT